MTRKTGILLGIAALLAILIFVDNFFSVEEKGNVNSKQQQTLTTSRLEYLLGLVNAEQDVQAAYSQVAIPYALRMSEAKTFFYEQIDPKQKAEQIVRLTVSELGGELKSIIVGEPHIEGLGVYVVSMTVKIIAFSHRSVFRVLSELANFNFGMTWESFSIKTDMEEKQIMLQGKLSMVLVEAQE